MFHRHTFTACAAAVLAGAIPAQQKGGIPPEFGFEKVWNDGPSSFAELQGHVVILDFSQTW
ncbi:MAG TPA: hypothetical protein VFZ65_00230 [Planctomycetota bacterium]|nr:hypothetical protein [Planctomycetota bacterium]